MCYCGTSWMTSTLWCIYTRVKRRAGGMVMTGMATRYLYLVRHGEASPDESGLSENGRRQALLLGQRLRDRPISVAYHGPLPRAAQTARLVTEQLSGVALDVSEAAGDY